MTLRSSLLTAAAATLVAVGLIPAVHADEWNKRTVVTLSEPLIAGNKVLQPGTYVWQLMDSPVNRNVVRIYNDSGSKLETTVLAIPNERLQRSDKGQFVFWETPAGVPKAVRAWFYPGDNVGQEFPYPKKLIAQLASTQPVPIPASYNPAATAEPEPQPQTAAAPAPERVQTASAEPAPAPVPAPSAEPAPEKRPAPTAEPRALPKTASYGPLAALVGLFSLGFFGVLTLATKKS